MYVIRADGHTLFLLWDYKVVTWSSGYRDSGKTCCFFPCFTLHSVLEHCAWPSCTLPCVFFQVALPFVIVVAFIQVHISSRLSRHYILLKQLSIYIYTDDNKNYLEWYDGVIYTSLTRQSCYLLWLACPNYHNRNSNHHNAVMWMGWSPYNFLSRHRHTLPTREPFKYPVGRKKTRKKCATKEESALCLDEDQRAFGTFATATFNGYIKHQRIVKVMGKQVDGDDTYAKVWVEKLLCFYMHCHKSFVLSIFILGMYFSLVHKICINPNMCSPASHLSFLLHKKYNIRAIIKYTEKRRLYSCVSNKSIFSLSFFMFELFMHLTFPQPSSFFALYAICSVHITHLTILMLRFLCWHVIFMK